MRSSIGRRSFGVWLGLALAASMSTAPVASGGSEAGDEFWAPSLTLRSGIVIQSGSALAESSISTSGAPLRPRTTGRQTQIWPMLGADLEIMSPALDFVPGDPRFFARGGASYTFAGDKDVAKEGNPMEFAEPIPPQSALVNGKGSRTNIELRRPVYEASLGTALEFEVWERLLRVRVSAEYMRQKFDLKGETREARDIFGAVFTSQISGKTSEEFDAVGGGLGLELDVGRAGDFVTSVLVEQRVYGWVGGRAIEERQQGILSAEGLAAQIPTEATWRYQLDRVAYRTHVGLRIRWQPE